MIADIVFPEKERSFELDDIDLRILGELEIDARQTLTQIATSLNLSRQLLRYRFRRLEKMQIITGYITLINFTMLGYSHYRTMIRFSNITPQIQVEILDYLMKHPNVEWLRACGGRWDLIVNFIARNVIQCNYFITELHNRFPQQIQNYDVLVTIEVIDFGRDYFFGQKRKHKDIYYFGREYRSIEFDEIDIQILHLISENARISYINISDKIGLKSNTVIKRIEKMKQKGLIRGFKPIINFENMPHSAFKALIKFHNVTEKDKDDIIDYLKLNANVIAIIKLIGLWEFEIEFEYESRERAAQFTRDFRDKYRNVIHTFEVIPLFKEYRFNFFPGDLLEKYYSAKSK